MKTLRLCIGSIAISAIMAGTSERPALAATRYIVNGTLAYRANSLATCSLHTGNFWKTFVHVQGPSTGTHSGKPASSRIGRWHAYPKGSDRILDQSVAAIPQVGPGLAGTASITAYDWDAEVE